MTRSVLLFLVAGSIPLAAGAQEVTGTEKAQTSRRFFLEAGGGGAVLGCEGCGGKEEDGYVARIAALWSLDDRIDLQAAFEGVLAEVPEKARNPVFLSLGFRLHWFSRRRFYTRFDWGIIWTDRYSPDGDRWARDPGHAASFAMGYDWPIGNAFQLGPYIGDWQVYDQGRGAQVINVGFVGKYQLGVPPSPDPPPEDTQELPDIPRAGPALLLGGGPIYGGTGVSLDHYFADQRYSVFGSVGYSPAFESDDPSGVAVAAGVRAYTKGVKHRGFLELSVSQIELSNQIVEEPDSEPTVVGTDRTYGPGIQVGYRYTRSSGFTFLISAGVGYGLPDGPWRFLAPIGLGFTWP